MKIKNKFKSLNEISNVNEILIFYIIEKKRLEN